MNRQSFIGLPWKKLVNKKEIILTRIIFSKKYRLLVFESLILFQNGKFAVVGTYDGRCIFYNTDQLKYYTMIHVRSTRGKNKQGRKVTGIEPMPGEDKVKIMLSTYVYYTHTFIFNSKHYIFIRGPSA